jgi:hypothetical protein
MPVEYVNSSYLGQLAHQSAVDSHVYYSHALSAITWSAVWVEATLNDLWHFLENSPGATLTEAEQRLRDLVRSLQLSGRSVPVRTRLGALFVATRDGEFPASEAPWRDFLLLYQLRNAIVHQRPERFQSRLIPSSDGHQELPTKLHDLLERMIELGVVPRPKPGTFYPLMNALRSTPTAMWAFRTAASTIRAILALLAPSQLHNRLEVSVSQVPAP